MATNEENGVEATEVPAEETTGTAYQPELIHDSILDTEEMKKNLCRWNCPRFKG